MLVKSKINYETGGKTLHCVAWISHCSWNFTRLCMEGANGSRPAPAEAAGVPVAGEEQARKWETLVAQNKLQKTRRVPTVSCTSRSIPEGGCVGPPFAPGEIIRRVIDLNNRQQLK